MGRVGKAVLLSRSICDGLRWAGGIAFAEERVKGRVSVVVTVRLCFHLLSSPLLSRFPRGRGAVGSGAQESRVRSEVRLGRSDYCSVSSGSQS
jgi:hypothetical protein